MDKKEVFFSFSNTAREIMKGKISIEEVKVLVSNTAAESAEELAQGYAYMGKEIENIARDLFPNMVQYRKAPSFVDYFHDRKFNSIINITAMFPRISGQNFKEVYQKCWVYEAQYPHRDENELPRSRDYWDKIFTECGLL